MLGSRQRDQQEWQIISSLQDLIPDDYILKKVDRTVDFS
jgi:hypothetical protein